MNKSYISLLSISACFLLIGCNNNEKSVESITIPASTEIAPHLENPSESIIEKPTIQLPNDEKKFINIVSKAQQDAENANNDMQRGGIFSRRNEALCNLLQDLNISDWIGTVKNLGANSDGKGVLEIELARNISLKTWNNSFSDLDYHTLIDPNEKLFKTASNLIVGQKIALSGNFFRDNDSCLLEGSLTLQGKLSDPEFIFKYSAVGEPILKTSVTPAPTTIKDSPSQNLPNLSTKVISPSFDCKKARSDSEKLICADEDLANLDNNLSHIYENSKLKALDKKRFAEENSYEWKWREHNCHDKNCLLDWYKRREDELNSFNTRLEQGIPPIGSSPTN
ncbi:MAG: hypothetical protein KGI13_02250 [Betaproteobacteria bacterium]|nr:hypothetical protein [Betaproteobacteria bacterium]